MFFNKTHACDKLLVERRMVRYMVYSNSFKRRLKNEISKALEKEQIQKNVHSYRSQGTPEKRPHKPDERRD